VGAAARAPWLRASARGIVIRLVAAGAAVSGAGIKGSEFLIGSRSLTPWSPWSSRAQSRDLHLESVPEGRSGDVGDFPDLASERDDVGGVVDDLERGRSVQPVDDGRDSTVLVDPHERAGVGIRRSAVERTVPEAL